MVTDRDIAVKAQQVRDAYAVHGFHSPEYQNSFDELHDMRMSAMATKFRCERGLPPNAKTPYCAN